MRYLVYLLLVVNVGYFGWNLFHEGGAVVETGREYSPLPATAVRLVTLQELKGGAARGPDRAADELDALTMTQPPGAGMPAACQALGPFFDEEEVQAMAARFIERGLEPRQRLAEDRRQNGYWVYLPAMERAEALRIAGELEARNDREYYIGKDNFISLGTFEESGRAEIRLRQVQAMGLEANLEPRYVAQDAYWLEFRDGKVARPLLEEIVAGNPALRLQARSCL